MRLRLTACAVFPFYERVTRPRYGGGYLWIRVKVLDNGNRWEKSGSEKELCGGENDTLRMKLLHVGKHGSRAKTLRYS